MLSGCQATPGCIAYIGISYESKVQAAGLGLAALKNAAGRYELPTPATDPGRVRSPRRQNATDRNTVDDLRLRS